MSRSLKTPYLQGSWSVLVVGSIVRHISTRTPPGEDSSEGRQMPSVRAGEELRLEGGQPAKTRWVCP